MTDSLISKINASAQDDAPKEVYDGPVTELFPRENQALVVLRVSSDHTRMHRISLNELRMLKAAFVDAPLRCEIRYHQGESSIFWHYIGNKDDPHRTEKAYLTEDILEKLDDDS